MRVMKRHELKCWPEFFEALVDGTKKFEYRKNDRDFCIGDILYIREYALRRNEQPYYTGRELLFKITFILHGHLWAGLEDDYCIMSIEKI